MEITYLIIGCITGGLLGALIVYLALKSSSVSRSSYEELNNLHIKNNADLTNALQKIRELNEENGKEKEQHLLSQDLLNDLKNEFAKLSAEYTSVNTQFQELKQLNNRQTSQLEVLTIEKQDILAKNAEFVAQNESLQQSLQTRKEEIIRIQEESRLQFENLATKILEEKTEK